jgi:hypothetical protein
VQNTAVHGKDRAITPMRRLFLLLTALLTLNACSLITAPISAAGYVAGSTVKATGGVAKAGIGACGSHGEKAAPQPQPQQAPAYPQQGYYPPQQPYYPQQGYAPPYPQQGYQQPYYPPQQQAQPQGYWHNGAWYPYAPRR